MRKAGLTVIEQLARVRYGYGSKKLRSLTWNPVLQVAHRVSARRSVTRLESLTVALKPKMKRKTGTAT